MKGKGGSCGIRKLSSGGKSGSSLPPDDQSDHVQCVGRVQAELGGKKGSEGRSKKDLVVRRSLQCPGPRIYCGVI